jgi:transcriptional regulator with XRE-family HTH domain
VIAPALVAEVRRLLAEGAMSQRAIARSVGVSRGTVAVIASGRRPDYEALRQVRDEEDESVGPPRRCSVCGGTVYMPCRLCKTREAMTLRQRRPAPPASDRAATTLDLRPEHQARFEEVRQARRTEVNPFRSHPTSLRNCHSEQSEESPPISGRDPSLCSG